MGWTEAWLQVQELLMWLIETLLEFEIDFSCCECFMSSCCCFGNYTRLGLRFDRHF